MRWGVREDRELQLLKMFYFLKLLVTVEGPCEPGAVCPAAQVYFRYVQP